MEKLVNVIKMILGPKASNALIGQSFGVPNVATDDITAEKGIKFKNKVENVGASLAMKVMNATFDTADDDTA
jgi:chaperonin GroEL (HSP60 family)